MCPHCVISSQDQEPNYTDLQRHILHGKLPMFSAARSDTQPILQHQRGIGEARAARSRSVNARRCHGGLANETVTVTPVVRYGRTASCLYCRAQSCNLDTPKQQSVDFVELDAEHEATAKMGLGLGTINTGSSFMSSRRQTFERRTEYCRHGATIRRDVRLM